MSSQDERAASWLDCSPLRSSPYLTFEQVPNPGRKTGIWNVRSVSSGALLGVIRWYGPWRQYCFWPEPETIFNTDCLRVIEDRVETCIRWQRNVQANVKALRKELDAHGR